MHDVAVGLDLHQLVDDDAAVLAHAPEVVAPEVDEHHVLGALLLVGQQLARDPPVLLGGGAARAGSGDRLGADVAPGDGQQRLGARARHLEVAEVEEVHVGAGVDRAQAAVDREGLDGHGGRPALGGHDLEGVSGVDVLDDALHHAFELRPRHVRLERGHLPRRLPRSARGTGPASRSHLGDRARGRRVGALDVGLGVEIGVGEDRDRVLEVVEDDQRVGEHQRHVGQPERIGLGVAERLHGAHEVIAEEAHRAAGERRRVGHRRLAEAGDVLGRERVRIAAVAERPAQHRARAKADERPAPHPLTLLGGLEQERGLARRERAQLQERRHRRLAILDEACAAAGSGCAARRARAPARGWARQRGPSAPVSVPRRQRRRPSSTRSASASERPRLRSSTSRW